jgi:aspartyl-tRNA(Asn)/glutamyl-tRNA(Gln) amidotransferase subunit A
MNELLKKNLYEIRELLDKKEISSPELLQICLERIEKVEPKLNALITITEDIAGAQANEAQKRIERNETTPLLGIPITLKDIFVTKDIRTTCGSKILENYIPQYDGTVVEKVIAAGGVMVGKNNMDEFAMGSSNENSYFGPVRNPWDLERVPGGSSGGSAASVAGLECYVSLGTDTGGSVRQPASFCGVVGLKPTYGRISRYGIIAFASSLDQVGIITRCVRDCAMVLEVIAGYDPKDSTSSPIPVPPYSRLLDEGIKGWKIGLPVEFLSEGLEEDVLKGIERAKEVLKEAGAEIVDVSLPHLPYAVSVYYIIAPSEASSNLARYDGVRYGLRVNSSDLIEMYMKTRAQGFGPEVKRRIMLGTYALSAGYYEAYYLKAQKVRTLIKKDFEKAFEKVDIIMGPVSPTTAFKIGEKTSDPLQMYLSDIFTIPVNLAGLGGISVPVGFDRKGLPVGIQFICKPYREDELLRCAYHFEKTNALKIEWPSLEDASPSQK